MRRAGAGDVVGRADRLGRPPGPSARRSVFAVPRINSGAANPAPKLATVVAGMCARRGQYRRHRRGPQRWYESAVRRRVRPVDGRNLVPWSSPSGMPANSSRCYVSIWWHCAGGSICWSGPMSRYSSISIRCCVRCMDTPNRACSYGHTKIAGKQVLRKGLSPLATTISTPRLGADDRRDAAARR